MQARSLQQFEVALHLPPPVVPPGNLPLAAIIRTQGLSVIAVGGVVLPVPVVEPLPLPPPDVTQGTLPPVDTPGTPPPDIPVVLPPVVPPPPINITEVQLSVVTQTPVLFW